LLFGDWLHYIFDWSHILFMIYFIDKPQHVKLLFSPLKRIEKMEKKSSDTINWKWEKEYSPFKILCKLLKRDDAHKFHWKFSHSEWVVWTNNTFVNDFPFSILWKLIFQYNTSSFCSRYTLGWLCACDCWVWSKIVLFLFVSVQDYF
jgi:hypothetical protein